MRKNSLFLIAFLSFLISGSLFGQVNHLCRVSYENGLQIREQQLINKKEALVSVRPRNAVTYVPVRFFLVAQNDGSGRPTEATALKALCQLNNAYEPHDIQFYLKEFRYYNNSTVWDDPMSNAGSFAIKNQMAGKYNAINVFLVNDAGGGAAAYYQPPAGPGGNDWIVSSGSYSDDERVLAHEVGHFFDLNHTFFGWECTENGFDGTQHANPQGLNSPCGNKNEFVDGSNCENSGDFLCDTPADYMFPTNNCTYNLQVKDAHGDLLNPDLNNIMNYAFNCDEYYFSPDQVEVVNNSLFSSARSYVRPNYTPNLQIVDSAPTLISPASSETIETYNNVPLEWSEVPGADYYLVEITSPTVGTFTYIVTENSMTVTDLAPGKTYLWRVLPYNEYSTCRGFTSQKIFKTGDSVNDTFEIPNLEEWNIVPNPVSGDGTLSVNVISTEPIEVSVNLYTMTGQLVQGYPHQKLGNGTSTFEMALNGIPSGIYLVTLQSEQGYETKRVSIH